MWQIVKIKVQVEKGQRESFVQDEEMYILVNKVYFSAQVLVSHRAENAALFRIKKEFACFTYIIYSQSISDTASPCYN